MNDPNPTTVEADPRINQVLFKTTDPTIQFASSNDMPAMTTMLYRVCDNDPDKFEEATRLVELFIVKALQYAER